MNVVGIVAAILLSAAIIVGVESVVLLFRGWVRGSIRDSLAYMVLIPRRRNWAVASFGIMVGGFLGATIGRLLSVLGVLDTVTGQAISAGTFAIAAVGLAVLVFIGLDPRPLDAGERLLLDQPTHILYSVGVVDRRESAPTDPGNSA